MSLDANRASAVKFLQCVGAGEIAAAADMLDPGGRYWNPSFGEMGRAQFQAAIEGAVQLFDGPMAIEIVSAIAEADRVAVEARSSVALKNGGRYANSYCFVFQFQGGAIVSLKEYADSAPAAALGPPTA